jgi:uncharacterized protein (DUF4415 family)
MGTRTRKYFLVATEWELQFQAGLALFEWDEQKNRMNRLKHRIGFEEAMHVFYALVEQDRPGGPTGRSGCAMRKIVRKALTERKLTTGHKRELAKLAAKPDSEIDYSDISPLSEKFWKNAVRNPFYRPVKEQVTLRIDADILAWLRQQGKGYQSRLNSLLRSAMLERLRDQEKSA